MIKAALAAILLVLPLARSRAQQGALNLSVIEGLETIGRADLTGVFSYVPPRDTPAAFADLLLRDEKSQKRYVAKVEGDFKVSGGITDWDRVVLQDIVTFYGSPAAANMKKPSSKLILKMASLVSAPSLSAEEIQAKRRGR